MESCEIPSTADALALINAVIHDLECIIGHLTLVQRQLAHETDEATRRLSAHIQTKELEDREILALLPQLAAKGPRKNNLCRLPSDLG